MDKEQYIKFLENQVEQWKNLVNQYETLLKKSTNDFMKLVELFDTSQQKSKS